MHVLNSPFAILKRIDLATQVADIIREAIRKGIWADEVPSERRISELIKASRPTIRSALHMLARDGLLEIKPRMRKRLLIARSRAPADVKKTVGIIAHEEINRLGLSVYGYLNELILRLSEEGYSVEIVVCKPTIVFSELAKLERILREKRILCCILLSVSLAVQRWFAERSFPALLLGSCHDSIRLPSLDIDLQAVCRHAAGIFLGLGHRRLAMIVPDAGLAGDLASEAGFMEGARLYAGNGKQVCSVIVRHNGTFRDITARLERIFNAPKAPTALLVAKPWPTLAVILFLMKRGLAVPDSVSLISRDPDPLFEMIDPQVSHYRFKGAVFTQRAAHLTLKIVHQGRLPAVPTLVCPDFFCGKSVSRNRSG